MKLIEHFEGLLKGGVILKINICAAGDNFQMDIIPVGKDSKTGVSLPPKALVGTAVELDAGLDEFLPKYAASVTRISQVVANADAELEMAEKAASEQARQAVADKAKDKSKSAPAKSHSSATPKRDPAKGMLEGREDDGQDDDLNDEAAGTTLNTTGDGQVAPGGGEGGGEALNPGLF